MLTSSGPTNDQIFCLPILRLVYYCLSDAQAQDLIVSTVGSGEYFLALNAARDKVCASSKAWCFLRKRDTCAILPVVLLIGADHGAPQLAEAQGRGDGGVQPVPGAMAVLFSLTPFLISLMLNNLALTVVACQVENCQKSQEESQPAPQGSSASCWRSNSPAWVREILCPQVDRMRERAHKVIRQRRPVQG